MNHAISTYTLNFYIAEGEAQMISLLTCTVIHRYKFKQEVNAVKFSPDGKLFAACCDDTGKDLFLHIAVYTECC